MFLFGPHSVEDYSVQGPAGKRLMRGQNLKIHGKSRLNTPYPTLPSCHAGARLHLAGIERCQWTPDGTHLILIAAFRIRMAIWSLLEKVCS